MYTHWWYRCVSFVYLYASVNVSVHPRLSVYLSACLSVCLSVSRLFVVVFISTCQVILFFLFFNENLSKLVFYAQSTGTVISGRKKWKEKKKKQWNKKVTHAILSLMECIKFVSVYNSTVHRVTPNSVQLGNTTTTSTTPTVVTEIPSAFARLSAEFREARWQTPSTGLRHPSFNHCRI